MRLSFGRLLAFSIWSLISTGILSAHAVSACTLTSVKTLKPDVTTSYAHECRQLWRNRTKVLDDLSSGTLAYSELRHLAKAMVEGTNNCKVRRGFAFRLADAAVGSPVRNGGHNGATSDFYSWAPKNLAQTRRDEVRLGTWLRSNTYVSGFCSPGHWRDYVPEGFSPQELRAALISGDYWDRSLRQFGTNPARDRMILNELIDEQSHLFDPMLAYKLVTKADSSWAENYTIEPFYSQVGSLRIDLAQALTDGRQGAPNYEAAARLLQWHRPFIHYGRKADDWQQAEPMWVRIWQSRLGSDDPAVKKAALYALLTRDNAAIAGKPLAATLPDNARLEILPNWPDSLAHISTERAYSLMARGASYPSRAIRERLAGRIELGLVFDPDGAFLKIHIGRSVKGILPEAARKTVARYFRPKLKQLRIEGYSGRYVFVPLPPIEYHLTRSAMTADAVFEDGVLKVYGRLR